MNFYDKPEPSNPLEFSKWEMKFQVPMPQDLRDLLMQSDGPVLYEEKTGKEIQFLSVHSSIEYYGAYQFPSFCKEAVPVAMDGCGNFIVYKIGSGNVSELIGMSSSNLGWEDSVHLAKGIDELIQMDSLIEEIIFG